MSYRTAVIYHHDADLVGAHLPDNYKVIGRTNEGNVVIAGHDRTGCGLGDYILPRLASESITGEEYYTVES
jgi:hypothetical protein